MNPTLTPPAKPERPLYPNTVHVDINGDTLPGQTNVNKHHAILNNYQNQQGLNLKPEINAAGNQPTPNGPFTPTKGGTRKIMKKNAHKKSKRQRGGNSKKQRGGNSKQQREGNSKDQAEKDTYLFKAIDIPDYDKVENALNNGADVNAKNNDGDTPLIRAIHVSDIEIVYLLLEHPDIDIELNVKNKELQLAEDLWDNMTQEDQEQNGIPYAIEEYIDGKNLEAQEAKVALFDVANKIGTDNPNTNAAKVLGQTVTVTDKNGNTRDIHNFAREINKYVGGKRKTRKKNSRGRKPRKK